jgi:iron complex outermembrane receptor protein
MLPLFPARPLSRLALAVASALLPCAPSLAADEAPPPTQVLDRVTVHGHLPTPATVDSTADARKRLEERAGGTTLVEGNAYRDRRVGTLADALGYATGVFVQPRFGAEEARLSIRGSGLQRTFHGRGIELLQDGSPLNLADGGFDFQAVEPLSAQYIEVYRGANALEYGAATLGGAVNFVSPTGFDAAPLVLRAETGADGYFRGQVAMAGVSGRADGHVSVTGSGQDGFREHATQENYRLFANAGWRFNAHTDGRLYLTRVDSRSQLPGNLTLEESQRDPSLAAPANIAQDQRRDFTLDRIAAKLAWTPDARHGLALSAFHARKSLHHPIFQVLEQHSSDTGIDLRWRGESMPGGHRNVLIAGITHARGSIEDDRFANIGGRAGARTNRFEQRAGNSKLYVENQTWLDAAWSVALGVQGLRATRRSDDRFITAGRDESFHRTYTAWSPKLGVRWQWNDHAQAFANLSRSAEPPSFGELSGGPGVTPVDAQRATTAELGLRITTPALELDAALYRARVDNELLSLNDAAGNPLGTVNADRTLHQGLELGLRWAPVETVSVSTNALWNDFRFDGDATYGDNTLAGVPRTQQRAEFRWQPHAAFYVAPNLDWVPDGYPIDHANSFRAPRYAVYGLRIGGDIAQRWRWFVDARNLADRKWIASTNVIADAHGRDGRNFLPGDGRSVYAGMEVVF